jgi:hypothetical protein
VTALGLHPSLRVLLSGGEDGDLHQWSLPDAGSMSTVPSLHTSHPQSTMQMPVWKASRGVSGILATEEYVVTTGFDGACYALHLLW